MEKKIQIRKKLSLTHAPFDYGSFEKEAIERLTAGDRLVGPDGVLTGLIQRLVDAALSGEMSSHLKDGRLNGISNRRNGHTRKRIDTDIGRVDLQPPRDREGTFEPKIVGKWQRQLGTGLDREILSLYAMGNSVGDIKHQLYEIYGLEYSEGSISAVTEEVWEEVISWQQRPLLPFYVTIFLDGQHFKTRENGKMATKVMYSVYAIDAEGERDILGIYIRDSEGALEWGRVLEDLKKRGIEDVLFFCVDGLPGFSEAILHVFPISFVQRCIVHMVRSSTRFVSDRDKKELCGDLRKIYSAADESQAQVALAAFGQKWGSRYPEIEKSWRENWDELMLFMEYGEQIRRMIYTTNAVEALHRQIRKVTKTKGGWVNDKSLIKQIYLLLMYGRRGWNKKVYNWVGISRELIEKYGARYSKHLS